MTATQESSSSPLSRSRILRTTLRSAHVVSVSALYGGAVYGVAREQLGAALLAGAVTGAAFALFEVTRSPLWILQVRGVITLLKLGLLMSVFPLWEWRVPLLSVALVAGVITSHMPGRYRYYSLVHGRGLESHEKG